MVHASRRTDDDPVGLVILFEVAVNLIPAEGLNMFSRS